MMLAGVFALALVAGIFAAAEVYERREQARRALLEAQTYLDLEPGWADDEFVGRVDVDESGVFGVGHDLSVSASPDSGEDAS